MADEPRSRRFRNVALRQVAVFFHRIIGLSLVVFLTVAGVTGSVITFEEELDMFLNPDLRRAPAAPEGAVPLAPGALYARVAAALPPSSRVTAMYLNREEGAATSFSVDPGSMRPGGDDEYFADPHSGEVLGSRRWGDLSQGRKNVIPFVYRLHFSLGLGEVGRILMGVVAVAWTVDCFIGAYLTFPVRSPSHQRVQSGRGRGAHTIGRWLARWSRAWWLKVSKVFALVFTWHRASGLWVWGMLLMFAWSSVALNLYEGVYHPVMSAVIAFDEPFLERAAPLSEARAEPKLTFPEALRRGQFLLAEGAKQRGFEIIAPERLRYFPRSGHFQYRAKSSLDITRRYANSSVWFDGDTGEFAALELPTGESAGGALTTWLYALHFGNWAAGGIWYRSLVCLCGLLVALLSVTGAWVWWGKRRRRLAPSRRTRATVSYENENDFHKQKNALRPRPLRRGSDITHDTF